MNERIAVVGAGAVGGYLGAQLSRLGADVVLIDPWPEHVDTIRAHGLRLTGMTPAESHTVQVETMHLTEVQSLSRRGTIDIAIIAVKSYDTAWATALIQSYLSPTGYVVSAQNSINEETIAGIVGWGRTVGCVVANNLALDLVAPGDVRRTMLRHPDVVSLFLGEVHGRITPRLEQLNALFSKFDVAQTTTNLWGERWSKLCVNGMRNAVSAATDMGGNARDSHDAVRGVVIRLACEAVRIGRALGYELGPIAGIEPSSLLAAAEGDAEALRIIDGRILAGAKSGSRSALQRPSMAQDIEKGRRTEIDHINGLIARRGREIGCPALTHEILTDIVQRVERGEIEARPGNLLGI